MWSLILQRGRLAVLPVKGWTKTKLINAEGMTRTGRNTLREFSQWSYLSTVWKGHIFTIWIYQEPRRYKKNNVKNI